ncbi:MAG: redoxin domain-containing protein [Armatimonadetes bacterium]|nr:redoxin domain-containing protein [Armatimonadota bacterium]
MRQIRTIATILLFAALAVAGVGQDPEIAFSGSDGHLHTVSALSHNCTLVLYFVKHDCSLLKRSFASYNQVGRAAQGSRKLAFFGVINGTDQDYRAFAKRFSPAFPFLLDYEKRLVIANGVRNSSEVLVVKDGKVTERIKGFSKSGMNRIAAIVSKASGRKVKADTTTAPDSETLGCHY